MMLTLFPLWAALISNISAQLIKPFVYYFRTGKFDIQYTVACGCFPSSHTSTVSALSLAVGLVEGFESTLFAVTCIFSLIVIYDAVNVRYYAGKGIQLTKQLISDLEDVMSLKLDDPIYFEKIKDVLGHRMIEAIGGFVLGIAITLILALFNGLL